MVDLNACNLIVPFERNGLFFNNSRERERVAKTTFHDINVL